jgi:hypothetical protein
MSSIDLTDQLQRRQSDLKQMALTDEQRVALNNEIQRRLLAKAEQKDIEARQHRLSLRIKEQEAAEKKDIEARKHRLSLRIKEQDAAEERAAAAQERAAEEHRTLVRDLVSIRCDIEGEHKAARKKK